MNDAHVPLACACAADLCPTFEARLTEYQAPNRFGWPYYVLLGTCADGHRKLRFAEALEQAGESTFDDDGALVYSQFGGYDGEVPAACGFEQEPGLGSITIGEDPAQDCEYCLVAGMDLGAGGVGNEPAYQELDTPPCDPKQLE